MLPGLVAARAAENPGAPALVTGDQTLSYGDLVRLAGDIAAALAERGIGPGAMVGVCVDRDAHLVASLLAVLRRGAAYIPIDPAFPAHRIAMMLEDAAPPLVIVSRRHTALFHGVDTELLAVEGVVETTAPPIIVPSPEDLAYVIHTSGSTGRPKGVMVTHGGLANVLQAMAELVGSGPDDRVLAVTTVSFDIAALELFMPLISGGTVVLAQRDEALDGRALARLIDTHRINLLQATPATWRMLIDSGWKGQPGLRGLIGGEALSRSLANELLTRVEALWNVYGPTETTIWSTAHRVRRGEGPVPIGRAAANTTLRIVDERGREVKEGQLLIGGVGVARGYLNREDLTAERFVPDPAAPGQRMYRTGDLVRRRSDGELEFIGRMDHQVKIRGFRVELGDVEAALSEIPELDEVIAGVSGDGEARSLVAWATLRNGHKVTLTDVRRHAAERLPPYMVPTQFTIVERMPRTANGKTDRSALAAMTRTSDLPAGIPAAKDDLDLIVLNVFRKVLGAGRLTHGDDFFDAGGHSLLAFRAAQDIERRTGRAVDITLIFENPTSRALAEVLRRRGGMAVPATAIDLQPEGAGPPVFCVCGLALYLPLARALAPDVPVCAIYVDADLGVFHGHGSGPLTVEGLAERYLEQVRLKQPEGPYRLAGFSMGGAVAYEVAARLIGAGQRVELVTIIDTVLADAVQVRRGAFVRSVLMRTATNGPAWAVSRLARAIRGRWTGPVPHVLNGHESAETRQRRLIEARANAVMQSYRPPRLNTDVLLYMGAGNYQPSYLRFKPAGGWAGVVNGSLDVRLIPGSHTELLANAASVLPIARGIREHLRLFDGTTCSKSAGTSACGAQ